MSRVRSTGWRNRCVRRVLCVFGLSLAGGLTLVSGALGATRSPHLAVHSVALPSVFSEANNARCQADLLEGIVRVCDTYQVTVTNNGAQKTDGTAITIKDTLPPGLQAKGIALFRLVPAGEVEQRGKEPVASGCTLVPLTCKFRSETIEGTPRTAILKPDEALEMQIYLTVSPGASGPLTNSVSVSGGAGENPPTSTTSTNELATEETVPFGASLGTEIAGLDGTPETQAGGHPYEFSTRFDLNSVIRRSPESQLISTTSEDLKDAVVELPLGFVGSATAAPTCTFGQLVSLVGCPPASRVGRLATEPESLGSANSWVYNMLPEHGVAAELGFTDVLNNTHAIYATVVPTPAGYVLRATAHEVPQIALTDVVASLFGDPAEKNGTAGPAAAFFTNPSDCSGEPLTTRLYTDSWQNPARFNPDGTPDLSDPNWNTSSSQTPPVTNCEALKELFKPTITAQPSSGQVDSPTGLDVNIKVPQDQSPETPGVPPLMQAVVTLPQGMTVNASSANGLEACSLAQVGISSSGEPNAAQPTCPNGSRIGTVELETPALASEICTEHTKNLAECPAETEREKVPLKGSIYLARQGENPFGSLLAIYIVVDDERTGVLVKLAGEVKADVNTGQLTTVVDNSPQFPFSELRTHFFAGNDASLRTPATCGAYAVSSELTPWSASESGPAAIPSGSFELSQGAGGAACAATPAQEPNSPAFQAGTTPSAAGAYSPLVVHLERSDGSQNFSQIAVTLPPGATGKIAGIPQCSNAQIAVAQGRSNLGEGALEAANPSCPAASAIGTVTVGAGAGATPFYVTGNAYLAGPYEGAPFSAVFITPAIAGPFDLGVVVVRAGLYIDPNTAQVTTKADPLPTILHGIPLDIRSVTVDVSRPGFTLNPTSCDAMTVTGQETSTQSQTASLSSPYQATSCANLAFKPVLSASTVGKASKATGASLAVKVAYPSGLFNGYSNIKSVKVSLPKQLPSRLTTLQKACLAATFEANPASCPAASDVGTATATTPLLASALTGPAYLVSHGNEAFPDLEIVLQGENVTLVLDGNTDIKKGITSSTFKSIPDAPVSGFELKLPTGKYSILGANVPEGAKYSLCGQSLAMPTQIAAQDGAVINQTTKIAIAGCAKKKALTRAQKLTAALKACGKKAKGKRAGCVKVARKAYGPVKAKKKNRA
jgi:hypothetical protein